MALDEEVNVAARVLPVEVVLFVVGVNGAEGSRDEGVGLGAGDLALLEKERDGFHDDTDEHAHDAVHGVGDMLVWGECCQDGVAVRIPKNGRDLSHPPCSLSLVEECVLLSFPVTRGTPSVANKKCEHSNLFVQPPENWGPVQCLNDTWLGNLTQGGGRR